MRHTDLAMWDSNPLFSWDRATKPLAVSLLRWKDSLNLQLTLTAAVYQAGFVQPWLPKAATLSPSQESLLSIAFHVTLSVLGAFPQPEFSKTLLGWYFVHHRQSCGTHMVI